MTVDPIIITAVVAFLCAWPGIKIKPGRNRDFQSRTPKPWDAWWQ